MAKQGESSQRNWYAIHTYSGYENAVIKNIKQRIESLSMQDLIFDALVPTEKKVKIKAGKKVLEEQKVYPGYVLVDMVVTDESWHVVRNTPRVTGFVGTGVHPVPVSETEMAFMLDLMKDTDINTEHNIDLTSGDLVKIVDGPFKDTEGKVVAFDTETGSVKVLVSMFGRDTELELDYMQLKRV